MNSYGYIFFAVYHQEMFLTKLKAELLVRHHSKVETMKIVMLTIFFGMRDTKYMNIIYRFFPDSTAIRQFTNIKLATLLVCINTSTFTTQLSCKKNSNLAIVENTKTETETYLKSSQTTKIELFAKIVNGWKLFTIFTKRPILVFW